MALPLFLDVFCYLVDFLAGLLHRAFFLAARKFHNRGEHCQHGDDTLPSFILMTTEKRK